MPNFSYYAFIDDWPELTVAVDQAEVLLRAQGRPVAADMLLKAFGHLDADLVKLGVEMSAIATEELRKQEHDTRVRPDTLGGGGPRLGDYLVAEPVGGGRMPGSVGVNNMDLLNAHVPWWITNEKGSSANVGRKLFGTFYGQDDGAPPDPDLFRAHPLFQPGPNESLAGPGVIENPIPARRFVTKAVALIDREWKIASEAIKARFLAEWVSIRAVQR